MKPLLCDKPRLLDLFCGAGGAAKGYADAGFEVVGVDIKPQKHFPYEFHQADALTYPLDGFDFIHASPPCQAYSVAKASQPHMVYPKLIDPIRDRLRASGVTYVIENVVGAPLIGPIILCGSSFGLTATDTTDGATLVLRRHRLFESNAVLFELPCECKRFKSLGVRIGGVYGGGPSNRHKTRNESWGRGGYTPPGSVREALMGIGWMTQYELTQSIPPAYTEWIGKQLLAYIQQKDCDHDAHTTEAGVVYGFCGEAVERCGKYIA